MHLNTSIVATTESTIESELMDDSKIIITTKFCKKIMRRHKRVSLRSEFVHKEIKEWDIKFCYIITINFHLLFIIYYCM